MSSNVTYAHAEPGKGVRPDHPAEIVQEKIEILDGPNGLVKWPAGRKKIAICGFAASSRDLAPFDDPEWSLFTINQLYRHVPRASVHFDVHANWREDNVPGTDHPKWLAECGIPVIMSTYEPSIPTCVNYPLERVMQKVTGIDYFTSTVAFMVSYAIMLIDEQVDAEVDKLAALARETEDGVGASQAQRDAHRLLMSPRSFAAWKAAEYGKREIALYGIDLIVGTEFDYQKACVEFLLGLAQARNITIRLPEACALLKQRWRYGYQTEPQGQLVKLAELKQREVALTGQREELLARLRTIDGALQENQYWGQVGDLRSKGGAVVLNES